jgi:hypothetical protein
MRIKPMLLTELLESDMTLSTQCGFVVSNCEDAGLEIFSLGAFGFGFLAPVDLPAASRDGDDARLKTKECVKNSLHVQVIFLFSFATYLSYRQLRLLSPIRQTPIGMPLRASCFSKLWLQ